MSNSFGDRGAELDAFKKINLSVIASAHGFEVDRKETTRRTTMMRSSNDKIGISQKGDEYVFVSNRDQTVGGTSIDFAQKIIEPGCSLGRVRQLLRPFLSGTYYASIQKKYAGKFAAEIQPSSGYDFEAIAKRVSSFQPIVGHNPYLCDERAIPAGLLEHPRVRGRVLFSPSQRSVIFPHYGPPADDPSCSSRCINGYEIKADKVNLFSSGGRKGLWGSAGRENDRVLAVCESGLDALSYLALHGGAGDTRVLSISGNINDVQPSLLESAIGRMEQGSRIVAAFDADLGGDKLTERLKEVATQSGRTDLEFRDHRPQPSLDWNDILMNLPQTKQALTPQFIARL